MAAMEHSRIKRIVLKREGFEIEIERECALSSVSADYFPQPHATLRTIHTESKTKVASEAAPMSEENAGALYVTSPMVGTFYGSPSPEDPPFVKVGSVLTEETVIGIIEAMKVMNEIKAGVQGSVTEILIKNGEPVE